MITGAQIRMSRGHLRWSVRDLSEACGVSAATIKRMEETDGMPNSLAANLAAIRQALEAAGVIFLDDGQLVDGGPGVRLRREGT
ncbi:helix-turn-helix domain-containing protein [Chelatococcus asaccharovorans]|mgnify:FL=1|uniref:helix-turn-helix domain-containing protein n=1 Tax=Chelatococcus asaccharovorans TaxID=28210 RepID=UPI00224C7BAF|nr:helix-turn-helix domain-containing protein [Chelatococcus asaccharovorans]CAH1649599.1 Transcriptional regulator [Chelatococcus asaccharovorans]CAH1686950.1 Transcriptional regulator [Chelatococcus asaccharovorans]